MNMPWGNQAMETDQASQSEGKADREDDGTVPVACEDFFVHESSYIDQPCQIGQGTKIWHFSHIMTNAKIGKNCNIGQNVVISPNVILGNGVKIQNNVSIYTGVICEEDVFLGPSCVFTNVINPRSFIERKNEYRTTLIKEGATIGANATIVCGYTIGRYALIGAGAVVSKDVPDFALLVGNPSRIIGYVCKCGQRLSFNDGQYQCLACQESYVLQNGKVKTQNEVDENGID